MWAAPREATNKRKSEMGTGGGCNRTGDWTLPIVDPQKSYSSNSLLTQKWEEPVVVEVGDDDLVVAGSLKLKKQDKLLTKLFKFEQKLIILLLF